MVGLEYARKRGYYGQGINVAVVDSGIAYHNAFGGKNSRRLIAAVDMVNGINGFYDDLGHGTHVAGIIGAADEHIAGMAPECGLISVKVLDRKGNGKIDNVTAGLGWIESYAGAYNIRIVNISVGTSTDKMYGEESVLVKHVDRLWDMGLVVIAAAGNNGPGGRSIGAPGISRKIITVGASDDESSGRSRGLKKSYSGRGPTDNCIMKPDIVAPGSNIYSCGIGMYGRNYQYKSGTSMSTPIVSGAVAVLLSKYPDMTNREVKIRLKNSAVDIGYPHEKQGWGMLNVERLLR